MDKNNRTHGFKGMLRDRMFPHTDIALQICKCKGKYIDYVYDRFIRNKPVELRSITVKQVLGLKAAVTYDDIQLWAWRHGKTISRKKLQQVPVEMRFFQFVDTIGWQELYQDGFLSSYLRDCSQISGQGFDYSWHGRPRGALHLW